MLQFEVYIIILNLLLRSIEPNHYSPINVQQLINQCERININTIWTTKTAQAVNMCSSKWVIRYLFDLSWTSSCHICNDLHECIPFYH